MIIAFLAVLGLCFGSFVEALTWRLYEQYFAKGKRQKAKSGLDPKLSILKGRSMCPHCHHLLSAKDLVPLCSWLSLGGKCRYCRQPIGWHAPLLELSMTGLFVASYLLWPGGDLFGDWFSSLQFISWIVTLVGLVALFVYDVRWMILPNKIVYPLAILAGFVGLVGVAVGEIQLMDMLLSVVIAGGLFLLLFQVSAGRWIGGGDVKFGLLAGLVLADGYLAFLMLLTASLAGTLFILPGLMLRRIKTTSRIPFGPFLVIGLIISFLLGPSIVEWYKDFLMLA